MRELEQSGKADVMSPRRGDLGSLQRSELLGAMPAYRSTGCKTTWSESPKQRNGQAGPVAG